MTGPAHDKPVVSGITPSSTRIWNYLLGGKDNYIVDRLVGDQIIAIAPQALDQARASRAFLVRAVTFLVNEAKVRQFIDVGPGLPIPNSTHQVAQRIAPDSAIVYVDNDPMVLAYARTLLTSCPPGRTGYVEADLREPADVLAEVGKLNVLDLTEPVALMLLCVLGHVGDWSEARRITSTLIAGLPPGSYLVVTDATNVLDPDAMNAAERIYNKTAVPSYRLRTPEQLRELFAGLELIEPGVVSCPRWRPDPHDIGSAVDVDMFGAVGRKP